MKALKKLAVLLLVVGIFCSFVPTASGYTPTYTTLKIGLNYGSGALATANLENRVGSGYTFGYYDSDRVFHALGATGETQITMMKDWNIYLSGGTYSDSAPSGNYSVIGCYHILLPDTYDSFDAAQAAAAPYGDAFPAYYSGSFRVCVGNYTSASEAEAAMAERGISGTAYTASSSCVTVTVTGTTNILFEFDYGSTYYLAVRPNSDGEKAQTWFRGYYYYGDFQYSRLDGGDLTVVNFVNIEDYVKGVIPYEMSASWPLEALKAQALCARTYAAGLINGHRSYGFDLCDTSCCQVYYGNNRATAHSDQAVDETAGQYVTYNGQLCDTYYHSSDGGATENSENVWVSALPYLRGVVDPHEALVNTGYSSWTSTYTREEITAILRSKGYNCADIVSVTPTYTEMGNIYSITFTDTNDRNWTFSKSAAGSILHSPSYGKYTYSQRFTIVSSGTDDGGDGSDSSIYVNGPSATLSGSLNDAYAIGGDGSISQITGSTVITGSGTEEIGGGSTGQEGDTYIVSGSGWGHNVGMSQYGAYSMALQGYSHEDIIKFYFTGVTIS